MKRVLMALILIGAIAAFGVAQAQTAAQPPSAESDRAVVVTSGDGLVKRAPDRAWVDISAESRARTPQEAQKQNADVMSAVLQKLKATGLSNDAIKTRAYQLQPEFDYRDGRQTLRGYVARNSVEVRVDDLPKVGEILDVAVSSGATSVGNVRFDLKDRDAAEREALRLAVADARSRADAAASGAGMKVERIVRIEEQRARLVQPMPMEFARSAAAAGDAAPPVSPGELEIRATVTLTSAIR